MRASDALTTRESRAAILGLVVAGWAVLVIGAATERAFLLATGAAMVAIVNLYLAKALLETYSAIKSVDAAQESGGRALRLMLADLDDQRAHARELGTDLNDLRSHTRELGTDLASQQGVLELLREEVTAMTESIAEQRRQHDDATTGHAALAGAIDEARSELARLAGDHETTRMALVATRGMTDRLAERARSASIENRRLQAVASTNVESPLLSIAIPSFNRPERLAALLGSVASEVAACQPGLVEVCITDDASTDLDTVETALTFAEQHRFASLRLQPSNVGIERNVIAAGEPCRGEYLLLIGNDDLMIPGTLRTILDDIRNTEAPLLLYAKQRINLDGSERSPVVGSIPIELPIGAAHVFESCADAAREQGLLSTFGFIGPMVRRRSPFLEVDPTPYHDLTMYSQVFVTIEAFAKQAVFYRNVATISHRTPTPSQKHAEALSRPEEEFMSGGNARLARYFGTSLAAALQRLIDRGALEYETVATLPERLMTKLQLVEWIAHNRSLDPTMDERLGAAVVADADRFFAALEGVSPPEKRS